MDEKRHPAKDGGSRPARRQTRSTSLARIVAFSGLSLAALTFAVYRFPKDCHLPGAFRHPEPPVEAELTIEEKALRVLERNPLIDGHNDLLIMIRANYRNKLYGELRDRIENGSLEQHTDLPRLDQGKSGGAFWSAYMPCPKNVTNFANDNYYSIVRATLEQLDAYHRLSDLYPTYFTPTKSSAEALEAFETGRLISPLAIEGLHQIGNSLSTLRLYHKLGVRYATLTWNCHNAYADAAVTPTEDGDIAVSTPLWHGVSPAGRDLIYEMNRLGMLVDLAHVSPDTMRDVLQGSAGWNGSLAPPIFSHSSAHAICPHPRNVPDDVLHLVKKRNSIVMVNFSPDFISCVPNDSPRGIPSYYQPNATLGQVVRHIRHIGDLIGYDHVGLGTDYDGIASTPRGLEDVSKFPDLIAELLRQGISEEDCGKIAGRNLLRVWNEADQVAARLQQSALPLEDELYEWVK